MSAKFPKASESITPTFLSESLFLFRALLKLAREPTTTTSSSACDESSSEETKLGKKSESDREKTDKTLKYFINNSIWCYSLDLL